MASSGSLSLHMLKVLGSQPGPFRNDYEDHYAQVGKSTGYHESTFALNPMDNHPKKDTAGASGPTKWISLTINQKTITVSGNGLSF